MEITEIQTLIAQNIHYWRLARRLSEKAVAEHLGITLKRLRRYESGGNSPTCDELIVIAKLFRCSVDDLCRGES